MAATPMEAAEDPTEEASSGSWMAPDTAGHRYPPLEITISRRFVRRSAAGDRCPLGMRPSHSVNGEVPSRELAPLPRGLAHSNDRREED